MIKLVAADLDGTILDAEHRLTKGNREAIEKLQAQGIEFLICTGRDIHGVAGMIEEEHITCNYICMNGAGTYNHQRQATEVVPMDKKDVGRILRTLIDMQFVPNIATSQGTVFVATKEEVEAYYISCIAPICAQFGIQESEIEEIGKYVENKDHLAATVEELLNQEIEIYKVEVYFKDTNASTVIRKQLEDIESIAIASFFPHNLEMTDRRATKGNALLRYAKGRGVAPDEIFAIGDSGNDIPMLSLDLGCTVAMGNAEEKVKAVAQHITKTNEEDGLAHAIYEHVLKT